MVKKCCNIRDESLTDDDLDISDYKSKLWRLAYGQTYQQEEYAGWEPILLQGTPGLAPSNQPCFPLARPKNTGTTIFDPLNCDNGIFITDPDRVADPISTDVDCQYCQDFGEWMGINGGNGAVSELKSNKGTKFRTGSFTCCNGNCDVKTNTEDLNHPIPYVLPQYVDQWADQKQTRQWPNIYYGLSFIEGNSYISSSPSRDFATRQGRSCAWEIIPRIGEIPYDPSTSQYANQKDHELAISKANQAHRTAGNFIVYQVGEPSRNPKENAWYKDNLAPLLGEFDYPQDTVNGDLPLLDLPTPEEFTVPYGFNNGTQNNVFVGNKKVTSWWKWDIEEAPIAWVLRTEQGFVDEEDGKWDHQFYIPPGDIFTARINPDENAGGLDSDGYKNGFQQCPSGVKFQDNGNLYILPHGTRAIYVSCNMYERFYDAYNAIKDIPDIEPSEVLEQAMYAATHPLIDKITIDLHKRYDIFIEQDTYVTNEGNFAGFGEYPISQQRSAKGKFANPYYQFMNWYDKKYMSYNKINLVETDLQLWNTLVSKYGTFIDARSKFDKTIEFDNNNLPPNSHIGIDLLYDFSVKYNNRANGRTAQPNQNNYPAFTNAGLQSNFNYASSPLSINEEFIQRAKYIRKNLEEDGVCQEMSDPVLFTNYQAFDGTTYQSEFLQSGYYSYKTYHIRNGTSKGSPAEYCFECDEYSSYRNYATQGCVPDDCFCDETDATDGSPCSGQGKAISDYTFRDERYYPIIFDPNATPLSVAYHKDGGIFYRGGSDSGTVRFSSDALVENTDTFKVRLEFDRNAPFFLRIYDMNLQALQSTSKDSYQCLRFPIVGQSSTPTILTDNEYVYQVDPPQEGRWDTQPAYIPGLTTRFSPKLTKYGGFNAEELQEMFPYGFEYLTDIGKKVIDGTTYRFDGDTPFGCYSSDTLSIKNYVETKGQITIDSSRGLMDHVVSMSEPGSFRTNRYNFNDEGREEPNPEYRRFSTYFELSSSVDILEKNGNLPSPSNPKAINPGGGRHRIDAIPQNSRGIRYSFYFRMANPYISALLDAAGDETNRNYYPIATNRRGWYDDLDYLGGTTAYCDNGRQFYDFGNQTSKPTITVAAIPKPIKAKFALYPPAPVQLKTRVNFNTDGQLRYINDKGIISTSFKNQLQRQNGDDPIPKLTFNNQVDFPRDPPIVQPFDFSESFLINEKESKSLAPLMRTISGFSENRKFKIVLKTKDGKFFQIDGIPNRYESHNKTYEGFPHFVQVVTNGSDTNSFLPGAVPLVQKKKMEDVTWVTKPNTQFAADISGNNYDPKWPLNLRLATGYDIDPIHNKLTFPGTRMFFTMFPKISVKNFASFNSNDDDVVDVGDVVRFENRTGTWYKYSRDGAFFQRYVIFNPFEDYTWQRYSDLHFDYLNKSYIGYVYNSKIDINPQGFTFYREPFGDRTKQARAICSSIRLKSYLVDARGKRVFPGTLRDPCIDTCTDGGLTFLRLETELQFDNALNSEWTEIDTAKTELLSYHIYKPECLNNERDPFLSNTYYRAKWSDILGYDGILFDHSENEAFVSKYYPPSKYNNNFYKMIVDNNNMSEIPTSRDGERHHSAVPYGNSASAPFRFNIHQKYNVDYGNDLVNSAEISGVHNYFPFMDINDRDWGEGFAGIDKFYVPETITDFNLEDENLVRPKLTETVQRGDKTYERNRPDLQMILTIPADAKITQTIPFDSPAEFVISDSLRADTPLYYLDEIDEDTDENCPGELDDLVPRVYDGSNFGLNFAGVINQSRPLKLKNTNMPKVTWRPDTSFALYTRYCDIDEETCETQECVTVGRGTTKLDGRYKLANPTKLTYSEIAGNDMLAFISYNAGLVNGMNGIRPPEILRSIHSPVDNNQKNDILYSKENPDKCNDFVVMPPDYGYPDWDSELNDTFLAGVKTYQDLIKTYTPARYLAETDRLAEEMTFRALYGEKETVNRTSFNGDTLLTPDQILNYIDPEIDVATMHDQILWSYESASSPALQRLQTTHSFTVNSRARPGDSASVSWAGVNVSATIQSNATSEWAGNVMVLTIAGRETNTYTLPITLHSATFSNLINVEAGEEQPEVADDQTITLMEENIKVVPDLVTEQRACASAGCPVDPFDPIETEEYEYYSKDYSSVNMGTWKFWLANWPRVEKYEWNDTFNVCDRNTDIWGTQTQTCQPFEFGYCNLTPERCPPCTGEVPAPQLEYRGEMDIRYYTNSGVPINNYVDTTVERFSYKYKECRNEITSNGHLYKHNYYHHPQKIFRFDLALQFESANYRLNLMTLPCIQGCSGNCNCSKDWRFPHPDGGCKGPCGQRLEIEDPGTGKCDAKCKVPEDGGLIEGACFCQGFPACYSADPASCFPYGVSACGLRFTGPVGPVGEDCAEVKAATDNRAYWGIVGYDPLTGQAAQCIGCNPRGFCSTPYFVATQDCSKVPQFFQADPICGTSDSGYGGYTWGRAIGRSYGSYGGLTTTPPLGTNDCGELSTGSGSGPDYGNLPNYNFDEVVETAWTTVFREFGQSYDTYLVDTFYGGETEDSRRVCQSGRNPDCVETLFSVTLDNDAVTVTFPSGLVGWVQSTSDNNEPCTGPALLSTSVTLCEDTIQQVTESSTSLEVRISDDMGYVGNYQKEDKEGCTNKVKVSLPPQTNDWAVRELDGQCIVQHWIGQHINENLVTGFGINAHVVCQSYEQPAAACIGQLALENPDTVFLSAAGGGDCWDEVYENQLYGVCEGTLRDTDCDDAVTCAIGEASWFEELKTLHADFMRRINGENLSIPVDNIIEGLVPGSVSELKTKTYLIPGGSKIKNNKAAYGVYTEGLYAYVTVAYYDYKFRTPHDIGSTILNTINASASEEAGEEGFGGCLGSRPFLPDPELEELSPLDSWFELCNEFGGDCSYDQYPFQQNGNWIFMQTRLNYTCVSRGSPFPNWYGFNVAPHGCFPTYSQFFGRFDTPPRNFLTTVPTIEKIACDQSYSCYYNDKLWPASETDFYGLTGQGTFLHCHRFLGKLWSYDYYQVF